jgi:UDP-4-amino-4-deoxy-L-arabinose-oxoglutarate aminotransferase
LKTEIPFYWHDLGQPELDAIAEVLRGPILTSGEYTDRFESEFAQILGRKHVLATSSCTGALHIALLALGVGPGDEVVTTPMTFIATAAAIAEVGAKPVFVDVEPDTGNLDAALVEAALTPRTRAILPVHLYGLMCDMRALRTIADRHGLAIVEDAAHCVEGERDGVRPGQLGDVACFSFFATKNLACGEGGALATDRTDLVQHLKLLRLHGMSKTSADRHRDGYQHWDMPVLGWKYNMDNIHAAILLPQLARLRAKLAVRHALAAHYEKTLSQIEGVRIPASRPNTVHARHLFPVWIDGGRRDEVLARFRSLRIGAVVNYRAIHLLSYFKRALGHREGDYPIAEQLGDMAVSVPFYPGMPVEHANTVAEVLGSILGKKPTSPRGGRYSHKSLPTRL